MVKKGGLKVLELQSHGRKVENFDANVKIAVKLYSFSNEFLDGAF